jgi:hypothetical protein
MALDNVVNFPFGTITTSPGTAGASWTANTANWPTGSFDMTIWPIGQLPSTSNAEIARVSASASTITASTRGAYGTTPQNVTANNFYCAQMVTANFISQISAAIAGNVTSFDTRTGAVTLTKADVTGTGLTYSDVSADQSGAAATAQTNAETYALNLIKSAWPVGSVYISTNSTNPNTVLGFGTWSQVAQGRCIMAVGTGTDIDSNTLAVTEGSGGDSIGEYKHTLQVGESGTSVHNHSTSGGAHTHGITDNGHGHSAGTNASFDSNNNYPGSGSAYIVATNDTSDTFFGGYANLSTTVASAFTNVATQSGSGPVTVANATAAVASNAHNNVAPYFGLYFFQRTV